MISRLFLVVLCLQGQMIYPMMPSILTDAPYFMSKPTVADLLKAKATEKAEESQTSKGKEHAPESSVSSAKPVPSLIAQQPAKEQELTKSQTKTSAEFEPIDFNGSPVRQLPVETYGRKLVDAIYSASKDRDSIPKVQVALTQLSLHENVREYWENEGGLAIVTQAKFAKENAMYWAHQASSEEFRKFTSLTHGQLVYNAINNLERIKRFDRQMTQKK